MLFIFSFYLCIFIFPSQICLYTLAQINLLYRCKPSTRKDSSCTKHKPSRTRVQCLNFSFRLHRRVHPGISLAYRVTCTEPPPSFILPSVTVSETTNLFISYFQIYRSRQKYQPRHPYDQKPSRDSNNPAVINLCCSFHGSVAFIPVLLRLA